MDRKSVFARREDTQRIGVIDIGSNSVRLVIFDVTGRTIRTFFNEKVQAGLGRNLNETGRLHGEGRLAALRALERYGAVMRGQRVMQTYAFATAAVREASDGAEFCAKIRDELGISIRILSGEDEARYAATGVIAMHPETDGISGDLGGSSLELSNISNGYYTGGSTYPLGPLALQADGDAKNGLSGVNVKDLTERVDSVLKDAPEITGSPTTFYMVGGAWRAIARIHMELNNYPLRLLQHYQMKAETLLDVCEQIISPGRRVSSLIQEIGNRRAQTLPTTALVLKRVIELGKFENVVTSSYGAREGILFETFSPSLRRTDPLVPGMRLLMRSEPAGALFGEALAKWIGPVATQTLPLRLVEAACIVADIGARLHPDHRSYMAFEWILTAPVTGITHAERAMMALAVGCRYERQFRHTASESLLNGAQRAKAKALGSLMRLGADYAGRTESLFEHATLKVDGTLLVLDLEAGARNLMSDMVYKRLERAATQLGLEAQFRLGGEAVSDIQLS